MITARAPAKTILFGEHAVVYNQAAICTALGLFTTAVITKSKGEIRLIIEALKIDTKTCLGVPTTRAFYELVERLGLNDLSVTVKSEIPIGMGLGSSASFACCLSAGLLVFKGMDPSKLDLEEINKQAFEMEKVFHGNSSGLDNTVVCYGGSNLFTITNGIRRIGNPRAKLFLVDTKIEKNTKRQVELYAKRMQEYPRVMEGINTAIGEISAQFVKECENNISFSKKFDGLIQINQGLLRAAGMSNAAIDIFVDRLAALGISAKITGAGGGGCVLVNVSEGEEGVEEIAKDMGMVVYKVEMGVAGVSVLI